MERVYLGITPENILSIWLMFGLGYLLFALAYQAYSKYSGQAS